MVYLAKKITLIVIALASLLSLADETHATTSYCVASAVECTSYVHPLGFTGYVRPTLGEIYGLTNQNVVDMMGVFSGALLVQTGAASLTTVYAGHVTWPGASRATKDQVLMTEFEAFTEDDILFPQGDYDLDHLAVFKTGWSFYVYALSDVVLSWSMAGGGTCNGSTDGWIYVWFATAPTTWLAAALINNTPFFYGPYKTYVSSWWGFSNDTYFSNLTLTTNNTSQNVNNIANFQTDNWSQNLKVCWTIKTEWANGSRAMCCRHV